MDDSDELTDDLESSYSELLEPQSNQTPQATAERIIKIGQDYLNKCQNDPDDSTNTPGAEGFSWSLWGCLLRAIGNWSSDQHYKENLDRAIGFVKALQAQPEDRMKFVLWRENISIKDLPLIGPSMRDANNGPFTYGGPNDSALGRVDVQNALAGGPVNTDKPDKDVELTLKRRKEHLAFQGFVARLWTDAGLDWFACSGVSTVGYGLEEWPIDPPSIGEGAGEETAAYYALMVECAAVWLRFAGAQIYACSEIWGPNGNPDWPQNAGAPGRGGARWHGIDGMDKERKRWGLWRDVLKEVVSWYDREAAAGRGSGWKVKDASVAALKAMDAAEKK